MADGAGEANGAAQRTGGQLDDGEVGEKVCQDSVEGGEYEEEEVYVMVELPPDIDGEELLSASAVTVQVLWTDSSSSASCCQYNHSVQIQPGCRK